ncbi:hypothetical protein VIN01S_23050 [Vibrio inusitatus NBRC 102082]|uniref:Uncharacterized protein n=1 Tax=Vibrio inusitatus NBRC 102082 TaxID=1219070 RepID=A0A4Y3HX00_9VIBR|nr:carbohydrate porin [Vibrio inusitatus]GEA51501.1 hypothetical protein VIN01S_23050 [Vibrio inusitatus NBRC 102082]
MIKKIILVGVASLPTQSFAEQNISLFDISPGFYSQLLRNPNVRQDGDLYYEDLRSKGIMLDSDITQIYQGTVKGESEDNNYSGSADLWLTLDIAKLGLWDKGALMIHSEIAFGSSFDSGGAALPLNFDSTMPGSEKGEATISEFLYLQGIPGNTILALGKTSWTFGMDTNLFANNERNQFIYTGLVNTPLLAPFVPYTSIGGSATTFFDNGLSMTFVATSNSTNANSVGLDDFTASEMTYGYSVEWVGDISGMPSNYNALAGITNKDTTDLDMSSSMLFDDILIGGINDTPDIESNVSIPEKTNNYAFSFSGSQYIYGQYDDNHNFNGVGIFARVSFAPEDRNLFSQFYSVGISGTEGLFNRKEDSWGLGWAGTYVSDDIRPNSDLYGHVLANSEEVIEGYYQVSINRNIQLSLHSQYVKPIMQSYDEQLVFSTRLQLNL